MPFIIEQEIFLKTIIVEATEILLFDIVNKFSQILSCVRICELGTVIWSMSIRTKGA